MKKGLILAVVIMMLCTTDCYAFPAAVDTDLAKQELVRETIRKYRERREASAWKGSRLQNNGMGVNHGPSGFETWYDLPMGGLFRYFGDEIGYGIEDCWVREDGVKMCGPYVMCAADLNHRKRGDLVETSLGTAIVVDYNGHIDISGNWTDIDIAVTWG